MNFVPRYEPGRYRDCKDCSGAGCDHCDANADADYTAAFTDGPRPIASVQRNDANGMAALKRCLGAEAIRSAFGPDGGGMPEIMEKVKAEFPNGVAVQRPAKQQSLF